RMNGANTSGNPSRTYGSYSITLTTNNPNGPSRDTAVKRTIEYSCGCAVTTQASRPPQICPICFPPGSEPPQSNRWKASGQSTAAGASPDVDPFQDTADAAMALVDKGKEMPGGFRSPSAFARPKPSLRRAETQKSIDPLTQSDDEGGYATPSEIALPESPTVETTSGSDSAVIGKSTNVNRSDSIFSAPPAYEDMEWTPVEAPSGRNSPFKGGHSDDSHLGVTGLLTLVADPLSSSPQKEKALPTDVPPRRKGLSGQTMTSSKPPGSVTNGIKESVTSAFSSKSPRVQSPILTPGLLGRPQNSKHAAVSPSAQPDGTSFPLFPTAPTNTLGISEDANMLKKPLVVSDPKKAADPSGFSNQDPYPIEYKKKTYPSGEHLYHAMKFMDTRPLLAEHIRECDDPKGEAARFFHEQNPGWDQMCLQKMDEVLQLKCKQHNAFKDQLKASGDTHIWFNDPDPFWGTGPDGKGQNQLGEALMRARTGLGGKGRFTRRL
ncbi:hypothetical protein FRB90_003735, partial [Tulasnella sp. 427]